MDTTTLLLGVLLSSIGLGFMIYGRRQQTISAFLCGLGLMLVPYVIDDIRLLVIAGLVLTAVPWWLARR
jgi:hypothetical protein